MNEVLALGAPALSLAMLAVAPLFPSASGGVSLRRHQQEVRVGARNVRVEMVEPAAVPAGATVLLFHGIGGMLGDGSLMRRSARALAARGFRAGIVHYFNATGTLFATHGGVREHAEAWREAMATVTRHYAAETGAPVGLFGYSLGGFLAVPVARDVSGVGAVVVLSGGVLEDHENTPLPRVPPLLLLHGVRDTKVPLARAEALDRLARRAGAPVELVTYAGEGHAFDARAERDALERAARFFHDRLEAGAAR